MRSTAAQNGFSMRQDIGIKYQEFVCNRTRNLTKAHEQLGGENLIENRVIGKELVAL